MALKLTKVLKRNPHPNGVKETLIEKVERKRGAQKGRPRPVGAGRKKGTPDKKTAFIKTTLEEAMTEVFSTLSDKEISEITPLQIMQLCTQAAIRAGQLGYAATLAEKWAPYVHPKMASVTPDDDPNKAIIIKGGLPDPKDKPEDENAGN
jgi:hypothetical protein